MAIKKTISVPIEYISDKLLTNETVRSALNLDYKTIQSISVKNAYIVVQEISGTKEYISFTLNIYKDSTKVALIETRRMGFTPDVSSDSTANYHTQIYNYIKTLPEFIGAFDV